MRPKTNPTADRAARTANPTDLLCSRGAPMKTRNPRVVLISLVGLCTSMVLALSACVEPPVDIYRVQPNAVDKSIFEGEWYVRHLLVDKQFQASYPFAGYEGGLDRIRWEITEDFLIAHRSYEKVPGTELANGGEQTVVAMYPITSHFDIRREYNPVNGVESNVISENTTDRPWWERDYLRVDWSNNQAPDSDVNGYVRFYAANTVTRNDDADPTDPWRVRVSRDYIETTASVILDVDPAACEAAGDWFANCGGGGVRLKTSFWKIDPENDYEPLDYPDHEPIRYGQRVNPVSGELEVCIEGDDNCAETRELWVYSGTYGDEICDPRVHDVDDCYPFTMPVFSRFGFFRTDRYLFDRDNGYTLIGRERLINRWNLWRRSKDDQGNPIPYAQREPTPIVFYANVHFPVELWDAVEQMASEWDVALRDTVAELQGKAIDEVPRLFEVRVNDCNFENVDAYIEAHEDRRELVADLARHGIEEIDLGNLENACAVLEHYSRYEHERDPGAWPEDEVFHWQRLGDLRYSFVNWVAKPELAGPLGYGPSAADPLTGEIISANANIYGASLDTYANLSADYIDFLNGRISVGDVINGTHVREHVERVRARYRDDLPESKVSGFLRLFDERTAHMSDDTYLKSVPLTSLNENLDRLAATGVEEELLITSDMLRLFGGEEAVGPGVSGDVLQRAKPSSWGRASAPAHLVTQASGDGGGVSSPVSNDAAALLTDPARRLAVVERQRRREDFFGRQSACYLAESVEPALVDLAHEYAELGLERAEMVRKIRGEILRAVLAHEVGHTLGLRHNFEGSADALNYFPEYWGVDLGDDHRMAGNTRRSETMYSSIMDYHQRFNSDWAGIGLYDKAAIKMGYGQLVEVFDEGSWNANTAVLDDPFLPRGWIENLDLFYPKDLPFLLSGGAANARLNTLYDDVYEQVNVEHDADAWMDVSTLGLTARPENLYKRTNVPLASFRREYARQQMRAYLGVDVPAEPADGRPPLIAVPYAYCSDAYAWGGNLTCNRYDMGPTSEDIVKNAAEMYEFYHLFQTFRGQRLWTFYDDGVSGYMARLYDRTYQPMLNAFRYFYYYRRSTASIWPLIRDWSAASYRGMNFFGRVLQTPEPGRYCLQGDMYVPEGEATPEACVSSALELSLGDARYYETAWTNEFEFRPINIGHFFDKIVAIQAMTSSNAFFFRDFSNYVSRGAFSIGYYRVFQPEMLKLYGGLILGNTADYAPRVSTSVEPALVYEPLIRLPGEEPASVGVQLKPSGSYVLRYYAMFFGLANLTSNLDNTLDFAERSRITLVGSRNDPVVDPAVTQIVFTDANTHYMYRAVAPDGEALSVGYRMLKDAHDFVNDGSDGEPEGPWAAAKRALSEAEASGDEVAILEAEAAFARMNRKLNEKVQLIEQFRQLSDALEYGN